MFAIINGALIQIIMASRVIYELSSRRQLPKFLNTIYQQTQTPLIATFLVVAVVLTFALVGRLGSLAEITSIVMLTIFSINTRKNYLRLDQ